MALQVWVTGTDGMKNLGLGGTRNLGSSTSNTNGKIGTCLKITTNYNSSCTLNPNTTDITMCGWFKFNLAELQTALNNSGYNSSRTTPTGNLLGQNSYGGLALCYQTNNLYASSGAINSISVYGAIRDSNSSSTCSALVISFDTWTHVILTWNHVTKLIILYINGVLKSTTTNAAITNITTWNFQINTNYVWGGKGPGKSIPLYFNDIRCYDNLLSEDEIHELNLGKVAHWCLDENSLDGQNLITSLLGGGQCTISGNTVNISGTNSDTYFYLKTSAAMESGKLYKISCTGSGFSSSAIYNFPIAGLSNTGPGQIKIKNGYCSMIFTANDTCANVGTTIIMDDTSRSAGAGTISNLRLVKLNKSCDISGNHNDLICNGVNIISYSDTKRYDKSIRLLAQNVNTGYLLTNTGISAITNGSVSFWAKVINKGNSGWLPFTGLSGSYYIMAWNNGGNFYHLTIGDNTKIIYCDGLVTTTFPNDTNWHYYVMTGINLSSWTTFKINNYGNTWNSDVAYSDVRLYATALSADDVQKLYKLGNV